MGSFSVRIEVAKPTAGPSFVRVPRILVDTGSEMTWITSDTLRSIRLDVRKKDQTFIMANGQHITRNIGYAIIRCGQFETIDEVVFAERGDLRLLGARTLEGFNAVVDSRRKRLVAAGPMPIAALRPLGIGDWGFPSPGTKHEIRNKSEGPTLK
ncbi:MAG: retroviral-like aspartic protease family protein [Phycisphaerae bacterium]